MNERSNERTNKQTNSVKKGLYKILEAKYTFSTFFFSSFFQMQTVEKETKHGLRAALQRFAKRNIRLRINDLAAYTKLSKLYTFS